ncbi:OPRK1 isoform 4 [Pongo abelii]|uniref:OPRK1 isoform 4 n=1 Tax=Pongo abelii TaxID=9601 RepID=A0A2J8UN46_PONAB|nr:OPRK1 isoform 4 [Pongo abelii]
MDSPIQIFRGEPGPTCAPSACLPANSSAWFPGWAEPDSNASAGSEDAQLEPAHISPAIPVIITAVYSVVFVVGLVGNSLVMFVIIRLEFQWRMTKPCDELRDPKGTGVKLRREALD